MTVMNSEWMRTQLDSLRPSRIDAREVRAAINEALERAGVSEASSIHIRVDGGRVVLHGTVGSAKARRLVERAPWTLSGVERVSSFIELAHETDIDPEC